MRFPRRFESVTHLFEQRNRVRKNLSPSSDLLKDISTQTLFIAILSIRRTHQTSLGVNND